MKLKYFVDSEGKKEYTLKKDRKVKEAHYKFLKVRDAPKSNAKFFKRK